MHGDSKEIKFSDPVGFWGQACVVLPASSALGLHYILTISYFRFAALLSLHFDLDAYPTDQVFDEEVVCRISRRSHIFPTLEFSENFNEKGSLSNDTPDAAQGKITSTVYCF